MARYIQVTASNIKDVAEDLMMDPAELSREYLRHQLRGDRLIFEVHEEESSKSQSFANRFNEDISQE